MSMSPKRICAVWRKRLTFEKPNKPLQTLFAEAFIVTPQLVLPARIF